MAAVDFDRFKRNVIQYFWDPQPTNNLEGSDLPIWCLGQQYALPSNTVNGTAPSSHGHKPPASDASDLKDDSYTKVSEQAIPAANSLDSSFDSGLAYDDKSNDANDAEDGGWPAPFLDDFESRLWFSYRSSFPPIAKSQDPQALSSMTFAVRLRSQLGDQSGFTSDTGWGCMIRSGQSLLANAILALRLGRDWRRGAATTQEREILSLFADDPKAPYSIHKFVEHGAEACGKHPGQWFGPSAAARCIQALTHRHKPTGLRVYLTGDGSDVYVNSFMKIAKPDGENFQPTLILVGTRLGIENVTPAYWEALKSSLQMSHSIGIAGGRPSSSHYFIGVQGPCFFYLDPHQTRPALPYRSNVSEYTEAEIGSCHTRRLRRLHIKEMDPSMLIGFLIRDEQDWENWQREVKNVQGKSIIHIAEREPTITSIEGERADAIDEVESFDEEEDADGLLDT